MKQATLAALATILVVAGSVEAKDKTYYSAGAFEDILYEARDNVRSTGVSTTQGEVPIVKGVEGGSGGEWRVHINAAWGVGDNTIRTVTFPGLIRFKGSRLEWLFLGQPAYQPRFAQAIYDHKRTQKAIRAWNKEFKDVEVSTGIEDGRLYLTHVYDFSQEGASEGDLEKRLRYFWRASSGVMLWTEHAWRDVRKDHMKKLQGNIDYLEKGDIPLITEDDDWADYEIEGAEAREGAWSFTWSDRPIELHNHGDSVLVEFRRTLNVSAAARAGFLDELNQWLAKNGAKKAEATHARLEGDELAVAARYHFDGSLKGKDFFEGYKDFINKYSARVEDEIDDLVEDMVDEFSDAKLTSLSNDQLLMLLQDNLEEFADEHDEAEGFWTFFYDDRGIEVHNFADRVVFSYYYELSEDLNDGEREKLLSKVSEWVDDHDARDAESMETLWYPGYGTTYLWVTATYPLNGTIKGEKLGEAYWDFKTDYTVDLEKEVVKQIERL